MNTNHINEIRYQVLSKKKWIDDGERCVYYPIVTIVTDTYESAKKSFEQWCINNHFERSDKFDYFIVRKYDWTI